MRNVKLSLSCTQEELLGKVLLTSQRFGFCWFEVMSGKDRRKVSLGDGSQLGSNQLSPVFNTVGWVRWIPPVDALIKVLMVSIWANGGQLSRKPHFHVSFLMPAGSSRMRGFCSQTLAGWSVGWVGVVLLGCVPALGGLALRLGLQLWDTLVWPSPDRGRNQACSMREIHSGLVPRAYRVTLGWL